jgi:transposase
MTKDEQARLVRLRSKLMQAAAASSRGVSQACRHFGISRKTFYKWKKRYDEHGDAGLCDQARTPRNMSNATPSEVVSKILYLRQNYHFGPRKIADYLKRFHQVSIAGSSVHRILRRRGMNRLPANQKYRQHAKRWKRYEKPQPGHRLQMDVKFSSASQEPASASTSSLRSTTALGSAC